MARRIRHTAVIVTTMGCLGASALFTGCKGGEERKPLSPEETVETFTRHIAAGDFGLAFNLCDSTSMHDYINECMRVWERLEQNDSSVFNITSGMLSEIEVNIDEVIKEGNSRLVLYTIGVEDNYKKKTMTLQKEGGEWKVMTIADRS